VARTSVSFKLLAALAQAHKAPPTCVAFAPNSKLFCTSAHDFTAKTWKEEQCELARNSTQISKHSSSVFKVVCVPTKPALMLSVSEEGEV
jgi:WD40 repeat protein